MPGVCAVPGSRSAARTWRRLGWKASLTGPTVPARLRVALGGRIVVGMQAEGDADDVLAFGPGRGPIRIALVVGALVVLAARQLRRAAASFAGLHPLAGGVVRDRRHAVLQQSIEARADPDALVHLMIERLPTQGPAGPWERDVSGDGFDRSTVAQDRRGWRFTATIVVRGTTAPVPAARAWAATAAVPD